MGLPFVLKSSSSSVLELCLSADLVLVVGFRVEASTFERFSETKRPAPS